MMVLVVLEADELEDLRQTVWVCALVLARCVSRVVVVLTQQQHRRQWWWMRGRGTGLEGEWCSTSHPSSAWPNGERSQTVDPYGWPRRSLHGE